jgi:hypothetical protein
VRGVTLVAAVVAAVALSPNIGAQERPTKASCVQEWNAPANTQARAHVARRGPWKSALLSAGTRHAITPTSVSGRTVHTCVLMLFGPRVRSTSEWLTVAADWKNGGLSPWRFTWQRGAVIRAYPPSNVRLNGDGHVTIL